MSEFTRKDACHFINVMPALQSLLYDLNLLPELALSSHQERQMMLIVAHWREAEYQRRLASEYAERMQKALRVAKCSFEIIHDRHVDEQDCDQDADGHRTLNRDGNTTVDCNIAIGEIDAALAKNPDHLAAAGVRRDDAERSVDGQAQRATEGEGRLTPNADSDVSDPSPDRTPTNAVELTVARPSPTVGQVWKHPTRGYVRLWASDAANWYALQCAENGLTLPHATTHVFDERNTEWTLHLPVEVLTVGMKEKP